MWVASANGRRKVLVDQTKKPGATLFQSLGTFFFAGEAVVEVRNDPESGDQGYVVADAVQFLPVKGFKK